MATKTVTDASFQADVLDSETPVLVDFWADWCGPCKMIAPALEEISDELAGKVTIAKMDIMENPEVPGRMGVQSIPLMVLFKGGQPVAQKVGAAPKSQLKGWIESALWAAYRFRRGGLPPSPPFHPTASGLLRRAGLFAPTDRPGTTNRRAGLPCRRPR